MLLSLTATEASRRANQLRMPRLLHRSWLAGRRNHRRRRSRCRSFSQIFLFQDEWPLQHHLDLGSGLDIDVSSPCEERNQSDGRESRAKAAKAARERMPTAKTGNRANGGPCRQRNLRGFGGVAGLVSVLFDRAFAVLHFLLAGARQAADDSGNLNHRSVGKDDGGEVHIELRSTLH